MEEEGEDARQASPPTSSDARQASPLASPERLSRRKRRSLLRRVFGTRLLVTFAFLLTLVTTVVFCVAGFVIHDTAYRALEQPLGHHLESVARLSAAHLSEARYAPYLKAACSGRDDEVTLQARLQLSKVCRQLKDKASVSEIVVFVGQAPDFVVIASSREGEESRRGARVRLLTDDLAIEQAQRSGQAESSSLYPDWLPQEELWQNYKGAYAPIPGTDGTTLAMVGVELPAEFTQTVERVDSRFKLLGLCAAITVLLAAVLLVRQRVHIPVYRLVRAMQGEDGTPQHARVRYNDEIGVLTERYNAMVDRLAEKDQKLRELYDRAREAATYLKEYSNALVEGVPSGVVAVDPQGRLTVWNPSARRILRRRVPLGTPAAKVLGEGHPLCRALLGALAGSVSDQALVVLDVEEGDDEEDPERQRLVELTCAPFHSEEGQLLGAAALVTDRTELERFRRAASRNERLAAIGNLGAGLAHEIKNPLGAISGFAELIERKGGEDAARLARRLRGELKDLNQFLDQFLSFAREDTIVRQPTNLNELVLRSIELGLQGSGFDTETVQAALDGGLIELRGGATLRVRIELAEGLPLLALDGSLIRSAGVNLVRNAVEAMRPTGGELRVRTHLIGDAVFLRFRDQGPGVPLENRERIFDPLFTTRAEGTGLGLAVSNKTVTAHGGKLSLRDAPGGGTEFVIRLPVIAAAVPAETAPEPAASGG